MGIQSSRIWLSSKDHKEIYLNGKYHDKMYIGSTLVWQKLGSTSSLFCWKLAYNSYNDKYYALLGDSSAGGSTSTFYPKTYIMYLAEGNIKGKFEGETETLQLKIVANLSSYYNKFFYEIIFFDDGTGIRLLFGTYTENNYNGITIDGWLDFDINGNLKLEVPSFNTDNSSLSSIECMSARSNFISTRNSETFYVDSDSSHLYGTSYEVAFDGTGNFDYLSKRHEIPIYDENICGWYPWVARELTPEKGDPTFKSGSKWITEEHKGSYYSSHCRYWLVGTEGGYVNDVIYQTTECSAGMCYLNCGECVAMLYNNGGVYRLVIWTDDFIKNPGGIASAEVVGEENVGNSYKALPETGLQSINSSGISVYKLSGLGAEKNNGFAILCKGSGSKSDYIITGYQDKNGQIKTEEFTILKKLAVYYATVYNGDALIYGYGTRFYYQFNNTEYGTLKIEFLE